MYTLYFQFLTSNFRLSIPTPKTVHDALVAKDQAISISVSIQFRIQFHLNSNFIQFPTPQAVHDALFAKDQEVEESNRKIASLERKLSSAQAALQQQSRAPGPGLDIQAALGRNLATFNLAF